MLAGVDNNFVTKILEAGGDPTIATYDGGFDDDEIVSEIGQLQCTGKVFFSQKLICFFNWEICLVVFKHDMKKKKEIFGAFSDDKNGDKLPKIKFLNL